MNAIAESTREVISFLESHPKVESVLYPFLESHPQYELARKQMKQGSGQFSLKLKTHDKSKINLFCESLKYFHLAVSWGGHESLVFPVHVKNSEAYPDNLLRFYVGLEDSHDLISDLKKGLDLIQGD
jgi:cystathionine beta-lyase/cystathionine gamma-synthase